MNGEATTATTGMTGMGWGLKRGFLQYIAALPDGRCVVDDGATVSDAHGMVFAPAPDPEFDRVTGDGTLGFHGRVVFTAHFGMLRVLIADPRMQVAGAAGVLTIRRAESARIPLVTFRSRFDRPATWHATEVRLTPEGSELFGGSYPAGAPFEPFTAVLPTDLHQPIDL